MDGHVSSLDTLAVVNHVNQSADGIAQALSTRPNPQVLNDIFASLEDDDEDGLLDEALLAALV